MTVYDDLKQVASEILSDPELRQSGVKLIQRTSGTGPDDEPGASTETEYDLDAVVTGPPYHFIKSGFVTATAQMVIAAIIDGVTVTKDDFIEINGVRCKIVEDLTVPGAGTRVVWKFLVQK